MALIYAAGTKRNDLHTGITTRRQMLDAINSTLVAAGWTSTETKAFSRVNYTGQPGNGNTLVLNGKTYTFQTVLTNSDGNVQIGGTALESYQNMKAAINLEAGAGVKYAAATTLHPTMECPSHLLPNYAGNLVNPSTIDANLVGLKIQAKTAGAAGRGLTLAETLVNATLTMPTTEHDGYFWDSAVTPEGLRCRVWGMDSGETANAPNLAIIRLHVGDINWSVRSHTREPNDTEDNSATGGCRIGIGNSTSWRVIANKHCFWIVLDGASGQFTQFAAGTVSLDDFGMTPLIVTAASNATPIRITTSTNHNLNNGDNVVLRNIGGNLAANGTFTVTVANVTQFDLDGSVGSGGYTSGGVCSKVADVGVAEALYLSGELNTFGRHALKVGGTTNWVCVNGQNHLSGTGIGTITTFPVIAAASDNAQHPTKWYNGRTLISEPLVGWGTSDGAVGRIIGQLYDAAVVMEAMVIDQPGNFDSHSWINLTDNNVGGIASAEGSLIVVVP